MAVNRSRFYDDAGADQVESLEAQFGIRQPYILYVGGRWHYKNFPIVLEAMRKLEARAGVKLVVAGPPWDQRECAEVLPHTAATNLRLVPNPSDDLLRRLYSSSAAFVFPSLHEGFGIPLLEAMSCGTPVVAADTGVFREVAGSAAVFFDPRDPEALVEALERTLNAATREEYRALGFARAGLYSWDRVAAATHETYRKVLGR